MRGVGSRWPALVAAGLALLGVAASALALGVSGYVGVDYRGFSHSPLDPRQRRNALSFAAQPELYQAWDDGRQSLLFVPFARADSADPQRSHLDVRELLYQRVDRDWELRAGIGKVFWGVTESQHLVDVVNQTDLVENVDGEDKLGQPMIDLALISDLGTLDLFVLPGFRERRFPGPAGRLRTAPRVAGERATYASSRARRRVDLAARWSQVIADVDLGLSHFYGTLREPELRAGLGTRGEPVLVPHYRVAHQTGVDLQATVESWLWKLEVIRRDAGVGAFHALTAGFEHTWFGVHDSVVDVGLLVEFLYDGRGGRAPVPFERDVFVGARIALNDAPSTQILAGVIEDLDGDGTVFSVEASRRFAGHWRLELEGRAWSGVAARDPLRALARDDYLQVSVRRYF